VARHVVTTERAHAFGKASSRRRFIPSATFGRIAFIIVEHLAPRIRPAIVTAKCALPLLGGRKSQAAPTTKRSRIIEVYIYNGVIRSRFEITSPSLLPAHALRDRAIARLRHKFCELLIGYGGLAHPECIDVGRCQRLPCQRLPPCLVVEV